MGRLAQPILMSMAVSPFVGAIAFQLGGPNLLLGLVTIIGVINVLLVSLLWTFGPSRYPALMGRLAQPILMSMAVSPFVGAIAFQLGGPNLLLGLVTIIGVINVLLVSLLWDFRPRALRRLKKISGCIS